MLDVQFQDKSSALRIQCGRIKSKDTIQVFLAYKVRAFENVYPSRRAPDVSEIYYIIAVLFMHAFKDARF